MSGQALESELVEAAARAAGGRRPSAAQAAAMLDAAAADESALRLVLGAACAVRDRERGAYRRTITFSKKSFFNLVNLCRDVCTYCTYRSEPAEGSAVTMSPRDVSALGEMSVRSGCVEALIVAGERPEERYAEARAWLARAGHGSTAEYIAHCSEELLGMGLFPHTNAGGLTRAELARLSSTNASVGLMLESASARLCGEGMPHANAPSKDPAARLAVLADAGSLGLPATTGVLIGIGETHAELADSFRAIAALHERYGHIQEVIVQSFRPKRGTAMRRAPAAGGRYLAAAAAIARLMMPRMNVQVPPNLSPGSYQDMIGAGVNDWGGVSPLTPDHVNPELAWPGLRQLEERTARAGMRLACRFPVYPEFVRMVPRRIRDRMAEVAEEDGSWLVREGRWRGP